MKQKTISKIVYIYFLSNKTFFLIINIFKTKDDIRRMLIINYIRVTNNIFASNLNYVNNNINTKES